MYVPYKLYATCKYVYVHVHTTQVRIIIFFVCNLLLRVFIVYLKATILIAATNFRDLVH